MASATKEGAENAAAPSAYAAAPMFNEIDDLWSLTDVVRHSKAAYWSVAREPTVCDDKDPYARLYANDELSSAKHSEVPEAQTGLHDSIYNSSQSSSLRKSGPERLSSGYAQNQRGTQIATASQPRVRPQSAPHGGRQIIKPKKKAAKGAPGSIYDQNETPGPGAYLPMPVLGKDAPACRIAESSVTSRVPMRPTHQFDVSKDRRYQPSPQDFDVQVDAVSGMRRATNIAFDNAKCRVPPAERGANSVPFCSKELAKTDFWGLHSPNILNYGKDLGFRSGGSKYSFPKAARFTVGEP